MPRPSVAIVGRPNVGKSTLFNRLVGSRIAIESSIPGVTRDRVLYTISRGDRVFDLLDTGGIGMVDQQHLESLVDRQIQVAIEEANLLLFLVDSREGITPLDEQVAERLRRANKPVLLIAAKADTDRIEEELPSFHALGFGDALPVSAKHKRNIDRLQAAILERLPPTDGEEEAPLHRDLLKIALVGRRNVGKSSTVNALVGAERVIVSETPGTTRDAVDIVIERGKDRFVVIDTAGLRKKNQMDDMMDFYAQLRTERAIRRADVVVLLLDATEEIGRVDKRLGDLILESYKPCILALNKWDLVQAKKPGISLEEFLPYLNDQLPGLWFCRVVGLSALTGKNVWGLIQSAFELVQQTEKKVSTPSVNASLTEAQKRRRPKPVHGKIGKIYYGLQTGSHPPTFTLFCNDPEFFDENYLRYLSARLREDLGFPEVPIRLLLKIAPKKEIGRYSER